MTNTIFTILFVLFVALIATGFMLAERALKEDRKRGATRNDKPTLVPHPDENHLHPPKFLPPLEPTKSNVVYVDFNPMDEPVDVMVYRTSLRLSAKGICQLVFAWCKGQQYLHIESHYHVDGVPIGAELNMEKRGIPDERRARV